VSDTFRPGDRVMHYSDSQWAAGLRGTVLLVDEGWLKVSWDGKFEPEDFLFDEVRHINGLDVMLELVDETNEASKVTIPVTLDARKDGRRGS